MSVVHALPSSHAGVFASVYVTTSWGCGPPPSVSSLLSKVNSILFPFSTESFTTQPALVAAPETKAATSGVTFQSRTTLSTVPVGTESVGVATKSPPALVQKVELLRRFHVTPDSVQLAATRWTS